VKHNKKSQITHFSNHKSRKSKRGIFCIKYCSEQVYRIENRGFKNIISPVLQRVSPFA